MTKKKCSKGKGLYLKPYDGKGLFLKPYRGRGLLNTLINHLPLNLTLPTYGWCGPGTNVEKNLANNVLPKNKLDSYCKEHDIFYKNNPDRVARNKADIKLAEQAWSIVNSKDASLSEKAVAYAITNIMKAKAKLGMGLKFPNKKDGQFSINRTRKRRASLSGSVSKKRTKKSETKSKRMRYN